MVMFLLWLLWYPLNLKSLDSVTSRICSKYLKVHKEGFATLCSINLTGLTLVDKINSILVIWASHQSKTKLLATNLLSIGYAYRGSPIPENLGPSACRKFKVKIPALQPFEES
ncbi:hypothetical protein SAY87_021398 [Trapa incisa]|uniref:Uncharacterized protein n=1 Tax=Trapa incisa TaxID=236973 RepID=A0AAN7PVZ2_9MYRT|nr:hypothetical protein SAY87_021398 [Trapa incisa]